jgi:GT2 family glycosyltransferase
MLIRRDVIEQVGLFDEEFYAYWEEVDLCARARQGGWQVWYAPESSVLHHGGRSFGGRTGVTQIAAHSISYFTGKHYGRLMKLLVRACISIRQNAASQRASHLGDHDG